MHQIHPCIAPTSAVVPPNADKGTKEQEQVLGGDDRGQNVIKKLNDENLMHDCLHTSCHIVRRQCIVLHRRAGPSDEPTGPTPGCGPRRRRSTPRRCPTGCAPGRTPGRRSQAAGQLSHILALISPQPPPTQSGDLHSSQFPFNFGQGFRLRHNALHFANASFTMPNRSNIAQFKHILRCAAKREIE